ncbi:MAG: RhuM family protein [Mesorhizobium sp.]
MNEDKNEPVRLVEDEDTGDRFLVYGTDKGLRLDIRYEGENLWMTQAQISELFGVTVASVSRHIANILEDGELPSDPTVTKIVTVRTEGTRRVARSVENYNLDMIISVGYRVSSAQATLFRRWATGILVQFAKKGFVVDSLRLKEPENRDRVAELREIIRDIRSDEANVYRELQQICAMCQDYDGAKSASEFFQRMQAKLVFAVTSQTPSEIVAERANHEAENMGLQTWPSTNIRKRDCTVSKNYLAESEIKELNRLTTILLDIFEDQLDIGRLVLMQDAQDLMDKQLQQLGRAILRNGGRTSASKARAIAEAEFERFDEQRKLERHQKADEGIAALAKEAKALPRARRT